MNPTVTSLKAAEGQAPAHQLMPHPGTLTGVPEGLEYLAVVDQLICKQEVNLFEVMTGFEMQNKYAILNNQQQQCYFATEESTDCMRMCCGTNRGFTLNIADNFQQVIMKVERPFKCCVGCSWCADNCCMYPMFVKDKSDNKLGTIRKMNSFCDPHFGVFDHDDRLLYELWGPTCPCQGPCCTDDIKFPIVNVKDKNEIGSINKIWAGVAREMYSNADTFGVTFPMNLDVKHKALLTATMFLIDFTMFEHKKNNNNNR